MHKAELTVDKLNLRRKLIQLNEEALETALGGQKLHVHFVIGWFGHSRGHSRSVYFIKGGLALAGGRRRRGQFFAVPIGFRRPRVRRSSPLLTPAVARVCQLNCN